jgi:hypothetical protein
VTIKRFMLARVVVAAVVPRSAAESPGTFVVGCLIVSPQPNRLAPIEKRLAWIEGKLNFGLSIIIVLSVLTFIKLFWPV